MEDNEIWIQCKHTLSSIIEKEESSRERAEEPINIFFQTVWLDARVRTIDGNGNHLQIFEEAANIAKRDQLDQNMIMYAVMLKKMYKEKVKLNIQNRKYPFMNFFLNGEDWLQKLKKHYTHTLHIH